MNSPSKQVIKLTINQRIELHQYLMKSCDLTQLKQLHFELPYDLGSGLSTERDEFTRELIFHAEQQNCLPQFFDLASQLSEELAAQLQAFQATLQPVPLKQAQQTHVMFAATAIKVQLNALSESERTEDAIRAVMRQVLKEEGINTQVARSIEHKLGDALQQEQITVEQINYRLQNLEQAFLTRLPQVENLVEAESKLGAEVAAHIPSTVQALEQGNFPEVDKHLNTIGRLLFSASEAIEDEERKRFIQWWAAKLMMAEAKRLRSNCKYMEAAQMFHAASELLPRSYNDFNELLSDCIDGCATSLYHAGQYAKALPLAQEALTIRQKIFPEAHTVVAVSLNNLAALYQAQGEYAAALPLFQKALAIKKQVLGTQHPDTAISLNSLAGLYRTQGEYTAALPLYQKALAIREQVLGTQHPSTATSLNNLALLYDSQGDYAAALPLHQKALAIREQVLGTQHPSTATSLNNLAFLYYSQGEYAAALPLFQKALAIREQVLGTQHPDTASSLNNLAALYYSQGEYVAALPLVQKVVEITQSRLGSEHPNTKKALKNLANCQAAMAKAPTEQDTAPTPNTPPAPPTTETPAPQTKPNIFQKFWQKLKS